jgi:hypothetical protein
MTNLEPKDAPRWIRLKTTANVSDKTSYTKLSKIVGLGHSVNVGNVDNRAITSMETMYAEDNPWLVYVYDRIDSPRKKANYLIIMDYLMKKAVERKGER